MNQRKQGCTDFFLFNFFFWVSLFLCQTSRAGLSHKENIWQDMCRGTRGRDSISWEEWEGRGMQQENKAMLSLLLSPRVCSLLVCSLGLCTPAQHTCENTSWAAQSSDLRCWEGLTTSKQKKAEKGTPVIAFMQELQKAGKKCRC